MNTDETTDIVLSEEQENEQVMRIASASLTNIRENRKTIEEIAEKYKGLTIDGVDDKANYKTVSAGITATRTARTTITKLTKAEKGYLKKAAELLDKEGELLISLVSPVEAELKAEKDRIDTLKEQAEQERLRAIEEQKQIRIAKLFALGMAFNGTYYQIGELTITPIQIVQSTEAQWEGFIAQATVEFDAIQLKQEEERKEQERIAEEQRKQQEEAQKALAEQQKLIDEANALKAEMMAERKVNRVKELQSKSFVEVSLRNCWEYRDFGVTNTFIETANKDEWEAKMVAADGYIAEASKPKVELIDPTPIVEGTVSTPFGGVTTKIMTTAQVEEFVNGTDTPNLYEEFKDMPVKGRIVTLAFTDKNPFIDAKVGKSTLRIYTEQFLDEANTGLTKEQVAASGSVNSELLFLVIKP